MFMPSLWDEIPSLNSGNWLDFSSVMEMLFYYQDADYLVGADTSTTIPHNCNLLDQQLFIHVLSQKIDDELMPIIAKTSSALQAWLLLTEHFQGPFSPVSPSVHDIMDTSVSSPVVMDTIVVPSPVHAVVMDTIIAPPVAMETIKDISCPSSPLGALMDIKCHPFPDQDYPLMDIRTHTSGSPSSSSLSVLSIAVAGKIPSYVAHSLAIPSLAFPIKTLLSHHGLALVTWPLTPPHLFHDWPG